MFLESLSQHYWVQTRIWDSEQWLRSSTQIKCIFKLSSNDLMIISQFIVMTNFTEVILQCEKPLHHWSDAFNLSCAQSRNRGNLESVQSYLEISWLETGQASAASPVCQHITIYQNMTCLDCLREPMGPSERCWLSLLASYSMELPSER